MKKLLLICLFAFSVFLSKSQNVSFSVDITQGCAPLTVHFTNTSTIDTAGVVFTWYHSDNSAQTQEFNSTHTFEFSSDFYTYVEARNSFGNYIGSASTYTKVEGNAGTFQSNSGFSVCPGTENYFYPNTNYSQLTWDMGDGTIYNNNNNCHHIYANAGDFTITLIATGSCGTDTITEQIHVGNDATPTAHANVNAGNTFCANNEITFSSYSEATSYLWFFGDGTFSSKQNPTHSYSSTGNYNIVLKVTNSCGNSDFDTTSVEITNSTQAYSWINTWNDNSCPNSDIYFNTGAAGNLTWNLGNGIFKTEREFTYQYADTGTYNVSLIVSNSCGDADTSYKIITVQYQTGNSINAEISFEDYNNWDNNGNPVNSVTLCPNIAIGFKNNSNSDGSIESFLWDFGDGTTYATTTSESVSHTYTNLGINTVMLIATSVCGSVDTTYKYINVDNSEQPNSTLQILPTTICAGEKIYFYDNNFDNNYSYNIWFGDGDSLMNTNELILSIRVLAEHTYSTAGTYNYLFTSTNVCGNSDTLQGNITVESSTTTPFNYVMNSTMNESQNQYTDFSTSTTGIEHKFIIPVDFAQWNSSVSDTVYYAFWYGGMSNFGGDPAGLALHDGLTAGNAFVPVNGNDSVTILAAWWCTGEIADGPQAMGFASQTYALVESGETLVDTIHLSGWDGFCTQSSNPNAACPGDDVTFTALGGISQEWHLPSGEIVNSNIATASFTNVGIYDAFVIITNGCGGKDTVHTQVDVQDNNLPQASFNTNGWACAFDTLEFRLNGNPNTSYQYLWDFGDGTTSTEMTPTKAYTLGGEFAIKLTVTNGCGSNFYVDTVNISQPQVEYNVSNGCDVQNNGFIDLNVNSGWWPMSFEWSNSETSQNIENLSAGNYTVTVTDNGGCKYIKTFEIAPVSVNVAFNVTNASCNGNSDGKITATASNGASPYYYFWENSQQTAEIQNLNAGFYTVTVVDNNACAKTQIAEVGEPNILSSSIVKTDLNCKNVATGTVNLTVSGGTSPFTYYWDNAETSEDLSNVFAGNYNVTVTDKNSCQTTNSTTLTEPATSISTSFVKTDASCGASNGSINLTVSGGTPNYSYEWSNGTTLQDLTNIDADYYYVTVKDANQCEKTETISIVNAGAPTVTATKVEVICNGGSNGSIDVTVSGGTPSYTFEWSNGATSQDIDNLFAGDYTITVSDVSSCKTILPIVISDPDAIVIDYIKKDVSCNGVCDGEIDLTVTGGNPPYDYNWVPWATNEFSEDQLNLCPDYYQVTVVDSKSCVDVKDSIIISEPDTIKIEYTTIPANGGNADGSIDITVTGGTPPYEYVWNVGAMQEDLINFPSFNYIVFVTDANNCENNVEVILDFVSSSQNITENNQIKVFPNPTNKGYFVVKIDKISENTNVELVDLSGKSIVKYNSIKNSELKVNTQNIESGIYFVRIVNNVNLVVRKIVVE